MNQFTLDSDPIPEQANWERFVVTTTFVIRQTKCFTTDTIQSGLMFHMFFLRKVSFMGLKG